MASTLKVLPWLYRSKTNADGKTPIYLRITNDTQRVEIATGYFIKQADWNTRTPALKTQHNMQTKLTSTYRCLVLK